MSVCCSEERAEHESNAINLQVSLDSYYHLWSRAPASEQKNEASSGNKFPLKGGNLFQHFNLKCINMAF